MWRGALIAVLALVWCAPAHAAAKTVARTGEFTLQAQEKGGKVCITLRRNRHYQGDQCGRIPRSAQRPVRMFPYIGFDNYAAAVPASVTTAETESRSGKRARHRTFAARGFAERFVLIPAPPSAMFVRFYGVDGTLLGIDGGPAGYIDLGANLTPVFGTHDEGVEAHTELRLAPTPDQADRLRTLACVDVANRFGGGGICDLDSENGLQLLGECGAPDLVGGIVAAGVESVRLTLGSGGEVGIPAQELPAVFGGRRAIGATVPPGEAVRTATALDAAGQGVAQILVGTEPGGRPCVGDDRGDVHFSGDLEPLAPPAGAVAVAAAGGESLLVADQGETLCVGLGSALPAGTCPPPPFDSDAPALIRQGRTVAGALSRDAARITLQLNRGRDVTVGTTDGPAYTGRWAGRVRFFAAQIAAGREVTGAVVRNAAGTIIGLSTKGIRVPRVKRTVLARRGAQRFELVRTSGEPPCLTAFATGPPQAPTFCTDPHPGTPIDGPVNRYRAAVTVPCDPRQAMVYGPLPDGLTAPQVILEGKRIIRPRTFSLRGENAWVAFLPDAAVEGLRAGKQSVPLQLPPASVQCGYSAHRSF
ncbi:hypothetical protein OM076_07585 [Solirubrobacter ginsenosidimutans]|uniref:Uncharacterized protein n=1 Tax=Solirubrobacter ginsenosidimutans TaxID=490573 RepID=A0A9X3MUN8_9ACTN|nr:hypothetical protein [Solirubrobacter ginsenosidimutans]MDA0160118.1 hypothetical protein [Solirubrobacter ginsenosidimutans]